MVGQTKGNKPVVMVKPQSRSGMMENSTIGGNMSSHQHGDNGNADGENLKPSAIGKIRSPFLEAQNKNVFKLPPKKPVVGGERSPNGLSQPAPVPWMQERKELKKVQENPGNSPFLSVPKDSPGLSPKDKFGSAFSKFDTSAAKGAAKPLPAKKPAAAMQRFQKTQPQVVTKTNCAKGPAQSAGLTDRSQENTTQGAQSSDVSELMRKFAAVGASRNPLTASKPRGPNSKGKSAGKKGSVRRVVSVRKRPSVRKNNIHSQNEARKKEELASLLNRAGSSQKRKVKTEMNGDKIQESDDDENYDDVITQTSHQDSLSVQNNDASKTIFGMNNNNRKAGVSRQSSRSSNEEDNYDDVLIPVAPPRIKRKSHTRVRNNGVSLEGAMEDEDIYDDTMVSRDPGYDTIDNDSDDYESVEEDETDSHKIGNKLKGSLHEKKKLLQRLSMRQVAKLGNMLIKAGQHLDEKSRVAPPAGRKTHHAQKHSNPGKKQHAFSSSSQEGWETESESEDDDGYEQMSKLDCPTTPTMEKGGPPRSPFFKRVEVDSALSGSEMDLIKKASVEDKASSVGRHGHSQSFTNHLKGQQLASVSMTTLKETKSVDDLLRPPAPLPRTGSSSSIIDTNCSLYTNAYQSSDSGDSDYLPILEDSLEREREGKSPEPPERLQSTRREKSTNDIPEVHIETWASTNETCRLSAASSDGYTDMDQLGQFLRRASIMIKEKAAVQRRWKSLAKSLPFRRMSAANALMKPYRPVSVLAYIKRTLLQENIFTNDRISRNRFKSRFSDEPLYQLYCRDAYSRLSMEIADDDDDMDNDGSDDYDDVALWQGKPPVYEDAAPVDPVKAEGCYKPRLKRYNTTQLLGNNGSILRTLWCEMPEVKKSGVLARMNSQERKVQEAMFEVITSEASYLKSLDILIDVFMCAPEFASEHSTNCVLERRDRHVLFSNLCTVRDVSEALLADLEETWQKNYMLTDICTILTKHATEKFDPYIVYCTNQTFQERQLRHLMEKNPAFKATLLSLQASSPCQGLDMHSFLMLPMQRITRLPLLVDAICHRLAPGTEQHQAAGDALTMLQSIVEKCNEGAKRMDQMEEMIRLDSKLEFKFAKKIPLVSGSRYLVKKGALTMITNNSLNILPFRKSRKSWTTKQNVFLFLFNDLLVLAKKKSFTEDQYAVIDYCSRINCQADLVEDDTVKTRIPGGVPSGCKHIFILVLHENHENCLVEMVLSCNSTSERMRWLESITPSQQQNEDEKVYEAWDCPQVQISHPYEAQQPDELSLVANDIINVSRKMADGWFEGENMRNGEKGWFPSNHGEEILNAHVRAKNRRHRYKLMALTLLNQEPKKRKK